MRVLCVCLGNICRSPAAEVALRMLAPDWTIDSAGTGDWHVGDPPYGPMQAAAAARGLDLSALRARQISPGDFAAFDLILAMDAQNLADIRALRPGPGGAEVRMFAPVDVPDPYFTRDFDTALDMICEAARGWVSGRNVPPNP